MFKPPMNNGGAQAAPAIPAGLSMLMKSFGFDPAQAIGVLAESAARFEAARLDVVMRLDRIEQAVLLGNRRLEELVQVTVAAAQVQKIRDEDILKRLSQIVLDMDNLHEEFKKCQKQQPRPRK